MVDTHKHQRDNIRTTIRNKRKALDDNALCAAGAALLSHFIPLLDKTKNLAGYQAMQGEIPLNAVFDYCHSNNITTLLPIMCNKRLAFAPFDANTTFKSVQYGILEPDVAQDDWWTPEQLELVLVPLVAFDKTYNRIGMGGGFYDRSFEFRKTDPAPPTLLGVAHAMQQVNDVHAQQWDVALDGVATDTELLMG